jgi:hypothetical protein
MKALFIRFITGQKAYAKSTRILGNYSNGSTDNPGVWWKPND